MDIERILAGKLINKSELAKMLWPNVSKPSVKLYNKMKEKQRQSLTDEDQKRIVEILTEYFK